MPSVAVLPPELASQIAAGEVVERPASAVKELLENALDAEAGRCDIEIEGGGITRLAVADDGVGMTPEDAALSVQRHATSKIRNIRELGRVGTFGFRGEALPSIASVSRFRLQTRRREADAGTEIRIEGNADPQVAPVGCRPGTLVEIGELFFNVPARRKFLRAINTESGHITDVVEQAALARPDVTFTLKRDGKQVREFLRAADRAERVQQVQRDGELAACSGQRGPLSVEAFLSRPEQARTGAQGLRMFINGRPVRDRSLAVCVAHAYGSVLERGRYPRGVVYVTIAPELVDINVHPQKAEVRFAEPRAVSDAVLSILAGALARAFSTPLRVTPARDQREPRSFTVRDPAASGAPPATGDRSDKSTAPTTSSPPGRPAAGPRLPTRQSAGTFSPSNRPRPPAPAPQTSFDLKAPATGDRATAQEQEHEPEQATQRVRSAGAEPDKREHATTPSTQDGVRWSSLRFVAQLRRTYLVCEADDGYYVLDQHAAAERVTFSRLRGAYQSQGVASQALLFPVTLEVSPGEAELVEKNAESLTEVGFDIQPRGSDHVSLHAVPKLLQRADPERIARDLLSELSRSGGRAFSDAVDLALATMACHGSLRAGDAITPEEANALLKSLDGTEFAGHCPHGRPIVTFSSWAELERKVGRR